MTVDVEALDLPEVDLFDPRLHTGPSGAGDHDVVRTQLGFLLRSYRGVHAALRHPDLRFASATLLGDDELGRTMLQRSRRNLLHRHGAEHTAFRKLVNRAFTPRTVDRVRPAMRRVVTDLVDAAVTDGECEFVADVAYPYPPRMICTLRGVEESRWQQISDWVEVLFSSFQLDPSKRTAIWATQQELDAAMLDVVRRKREEPGDDLVSDLIAVDEDGERLSDVDIATLADNLITAGTDTTRNELACGMFDLAVHPDQRDLLHGDRALLANAVEEMLRYRPVVPGTMREAVTDVEIEGIRYPAGSVLLLSFTGANRDPRVYPDPDRFDVTRVHEQPVVSFGGGAHFCLGAALTRAELQEALDVILDRIPSFELGVGPDAVRWKPMVGIGGPEALPLRFRR